MWFVLDNNSAVIQFNNNFVKQLNSVYLFLINTSYDQNSGTKFFHATNEAQIGLLYQCIVSMFPNLYKKITY